jgi:hypothetical protein
MIGLLATVKPVILSVVNKSKFSNISYSEEKNNCESENLKRLESNSANLKLCRSGLGYIRLIAVWRIILQEISCFQ